MLLKRKHADARRNARDGAFLSKGRWIREIPSRVHNMIFSPKEVWKAIKTLRDGCNSHHADHKPIIFRIANGILIKFDKDVANG